MAEEKKYTIGTVTQVIGPVVDVKFPEGELPDIYNAVHILKEDGSELVMEAQQHLGEQTVRCVALDATEGLVRGLKAKDMADKYLGGKGGSMVVFGVKGGASAGQACVEKAKLMSHLANVGDAKTLIIHAKPAKLQ